MRRVVVALWLPCLSAPALGQEPAADRCAGLAKAEEWPRAAVCIAQRGAQAAKVCGDNDHEVRARIFEQDGRFEAAAASWHKAAMVCKDEAQLARSRRSNALAQVEAAIDLLLAGNRQPAATALQSARRDFELQQDTLHATVPKPLQFVQNLAITGKGAIVRRLGGDVPESVVGVQRAPDGGAWLLTRADYGPVGGKVRLRKLDAGMRERRSLTVGQTGDDRPAALDVDPTGQVNAIGTTTARDGAVSTWLCRPPMYAGTTTVVALAGLGKPVAVAQHGDDIWVAAADAAGKPVLALVSPAGQERARHALDVRAFARTKKGLLAVDAAGRPVPLSAKGPGKPGKASKGPLGPTASGPFAGPGGPWRVSVEAVDEVTVVVLALLR
ncbi:MAG: hypothetical protein FJ100_18545 [Deltaproteobacteria bacterium]|nr:hypothetical protein [Deltaproteobacteria bacterium]